MTMTVAMTMKVVTMMKVAMMKTAATSIKVYMGLTVDSLLEGPNSPRTGTITYLPVY